MGRAGTLDFSKVAVGVSAQEIVDIAIDNIGATWNGSPAGFAWGISNLAGLPFFDRHDFTDGGANTFVTDIDGDGYDSPHRWDDNTHNDGWLPVWSDSHNAAARDIERVLRPGDIVRLYDYGNTHERSDPDCGDINSHTFIVVSTTGGDIQVVDTWGGNTVVQHSWSDIVSEMANSHGVFQSAYVSRVSDHALTGSDATTLQGKGYGDWSGMYWDLAITSAPTVSVTTVEGDLELDFSYRIANLGSLDTRVTRTALYLSTDTIFSGDHDDLLGSSRVAEITGGDSADQSGTFRLPDDLAPGTYYVFAVADSEHDIRESSESNNVSSFTSFRIGADLTVAAAPTLSWSAGAFNFSYRVDNIGATGAAASKTGLYLSKDATITTADTLLKVDNVAALLAGAHSTETGSITLPGGLAAGTYYVGAITDYTNSIGEISESNNASPGQRITIGPDLKISAAPTLTWNGTVLDFSYRVDNIGTTNAAASKAGIYLSKDATITAADTLLKADNVAALSAGGHSIETGSIALPNNLAAGTYYVGVVADYTKGIGELSETNNVSAGRAITIKPDLKVASASFAWDNGALSFSYRASNGGTAAAPASKTGIYLSTDATVTTADKLLRVDSVAALLAGGASTQTGSIAIPGNIAPGTYYVAAITDYDKKIGELNEGNNLSAVKKIVIGSDFDITSAPTLKVVWAQAGGSFTLTYTIANLGLTNATPSSTAGIYLSTDSTITTADKLIATDSVASLLAGASRGEGGTFVLPVSIASGNYYVGVVADYNKAVSEVSETNNGSSGVRITVVSNGADVIKATTGLKAWHGLGGNDTMTGSSDRDALYGDDGRDSLIGGNGNDTLIGGAGADVLVGGSGADYFQFNTVADIGKAAGSRDVVKDWDAAADYIDLRLIDANATTVANEAFSFVASRGTTFSGVRGELRWTTEDPAGTANDKTLVMGDVNGDKVADFVLEISGIHTMRAVDFLL